jgi:hypothetical protein
MNWRLWTRIVFAYLTLQSLQIGIWALLAPGSFFNDFPGMGRSWVATDGPFNEHLVRDVGALNIALAALFVAAAVTIDRRVVTIAAVAALLWGLPHLLYHAFNLDTLSTGDGLISLAGLAIFVALPVSVLLGQMGERPATT